jgi:hypothetical protein
MATTVAMTGTPTFRERYDQIKTVEQRKDDLIEVCFCWIPLVGRVLQVLVEGPWVTRPT